MEIEELNHVALFVKDLNASIAFYGTVLELQSIPRPDFNFPGAWFRLGARQELHLIGNRTEVLKTNKRHHFALKVKSIAETERFLKHKRVSYSGPKPRPDGAIQIFFQDPDGYNIEFFESDKGVYLV